MEDEEPQEVLEDISDDELSKLVNGWSLKVQTKIYKLLYALGVRIT